MSNELQNPNEEKCVPVTSTNLHEQISECVNDVSPMHDKESPRVPVNNAKSKQRTKRQRSKKAKLTATANPAEPHRPPFEQNRSSHQNRETPNVAQQIHFVDIGPNLAANINPPRVSFRDFVEPCDSTFELELLTIDGLRKLVNDIPVGKADGLDDIPTCLLKLSFPSIASSLTHILI